MIDSLLQLTLTLDCPCFNRGNLLVEEIAVLVNLPFFLQPVAGRVRAVLFLAILLLLFE